MGIIEQQVRARFQNLLKKTESLNNEEMQMEYNKLLKEVIIILAETIDNKCVPLAKNDFKE